jgi:prevent-host-death family protein
MRHVSIAALKAKLSEYLGYARNGEDVIVTDRGKPVARLTSLPSETAAEAHWDDLVRHGVMKRGRKKLPPQFWKMPRGDDPTGSVLRALIEEREAGR